MAKPPGSETTDMTTTRRPRTGAPKRAGAAVREPPIAQHLNRAHKVLLRSAMRAYPASAGVTAIEAFVLRHVGLHEPISARELASRATIDEGQISHVVKSIVARGLVVRETDPNDARRKVLTLSRSGRSVFKKVTSLADARQEMLLAGIAKRDRVLFFEILDRIVQNGEALLDRETIPD